MKQEKITVLAVSAYGVSIAAQLADRVRQILMPISNQVIVTHLAPAAVEGYTMNNPVDFMVVTHPVPCENALPVINGLSLLSKFEDKNTLEEIRQAAQAVSSFGAGAADRPT